MINLFNFQTHTMGQNQIMNSFMNSESFFGYNIDEDFNAYLWLVLKFEKISLPVTYFSYITNIIILVYNDLLYRFQSILSQLTRAYHSSNRLIETVLLVQVLSKSTKNW